MEINKIRLGDFNNIDFNNLNVIAKEMIEMLNQSSTLDYTLRNSMLNHIYSEYKRLCLSQCDEMALKYIQLAFTFHLFNDMLEQRSRVEQIKKLLNNI